MATLHSIMSLAVNNEKIFFMKRENKNFIIQGLFGDDMMHIVTNNKKSLRPERVRISPGVVLRLGPEDYPILPDPVEQWFYRSFVAKLQLWLR